MEKENQLFLEIRMSIPKEVQKYVTPLMIHEAMAYHKKMVAEHPEKEVIYFLGEENTTEVEFCLYHISSAAFWDFCSGGWHNALCKLLLGKVPLPLCKFFRDNKQGGSIELSIIRRMFEKMDDWWIEMEIEDIFKTWNDTPHLIEEIKNCYIKAGLKEQWERASERFGKNENERYEIIMQQNL